MKSVTIPLVGVHNQRDDAYGALTSAKDQRFINCVFNAVKNPITGDAKLFVEKRPGWSLGGTVKASTRCRYLAQGNNISTVYFEMSDGKVYSQAGVDNGSLSGITGHCYVTNGGSDYTMFSNGTDLYYAGSANTDFTADTTNGSPILTNVAGVSVAVYSGLPISGTGIPANTRILSVDSPTQITMTNNATASGSITVTVTGQIALVIDTDVENPTSVTQMDGYVFYPSQSTSYNGRIYNSDLNSLTSYSASNYLSVNEEADEISVIEKQKNSIISFGDRSISFFANEGNPSGSPLSRIRGSTITGIGIFVPTRNGWALTKAGDDIYFISSEYSGGIGVYKLASGQVVKVSTPQEDAIMSIVGSQDLVINSFKMMGYSYILVNSMAKSNPTSHNFSLAYNIELNVWSEWSGNLHTFVINQEVAASQTPLVIAASNCVTDGEYYRIPNSSNNYVYQDDGSAYTMTIQTSKTDFGSEKLKTVWNVALIGSDVQSSGTATLEYSDDDYATWTTAGTFDLTKINPTIKRVKAFRGGRAWRITHSANTPFRAQALKFDYEEGRH